MRRSSLGGVLVLVTLAAVALPATAAVVRYHYAPTVVAGYPSTSLKVGPDGAPGQWSSSLLSPRTEPYHFQPKATHMVTFRHPFSGQNVAVPLALPPGTPQLTYQPDAVVYTYTQYTIRVVFLRDGSVDVVYNSGLFRPLQP